MKDCDWKKRVQHEKKSAKWKRCYTKKCNTKSVQHKKVKLEMSAIWKKVQHLKSEALDECNTKKCNMKQHEERCNMRRVQHTRRCNMNRVQHEKSATWKDCHMKKCDTDKVKYQMSATQKKCNIKRVQHEATREKLQHKMSARVKYAKKSALEYCTRVYTWIRDRPLTDVYTLVFKKGFFNEESW